MIQINKNIGYAHNEKNANVNKKVIKPTPSDPRLNFELQRG